MTPPGPSPHAALPQDRGATLVVDSVTMLGPDARGRVAVAASHAGTYAAYLAARAGLRAVILNDAGVGRERAGIGGLDYLDDLGLPAAACGHDTARIGHGRDAIERGVISAVNRSAAALGVRVDSPVAEAVGLLAEAPASTAAPEPLREARTLLEPAQDGMPGLVLLDSAGLAGAQEAGQVVACGSHGGLLGGRPETALRAEAFAVLFNDAGVGLERAGISRLPALEARGIAAGTVSAWSARIGDGRSTCEDGFVTHQNARAAALGGLVGMSAREWIACLRRAARRGL